MQRYSLATTILEQEARALLTRLDRVKPFVLQMPMVHAASIPARALAAIERYLRRGRKRLRSRVNRFLKWLASAEGREATPEESQRRFTFLRMEFNTVLTQFDIFADVLNQRGEHETGVWLAGLDAIASDALQLRGRATMMPPVICYLDRGHGAAIRRARTRLPGGGKNPVAIVRVPRERMIGSGIGASLIHEVGHQGAALLGLVESLRPVLQSLQRKGGREELAWRLWERWISEIVADFWAVAKLGIGASLGLMGVMSLPRPFVFRISMDDPHPFPWIRMKLSCAIGNELYPHQQWSRLMELWESLYPSSGLDPSRLQVLGILEATLPSFISLLVHHRPQSLGGQSLKEVVGSSQYRPEELSEEFDSWDTTPRRMFKQEPTRVFAVIGQARADGKVSPEDESKILSRLLAHWAMKKSLQPEEQHFQFES